MTTLNMGAVVVLSPADFARLQADVRKMIHDCVVDDYLDAFKVLNLIVNEAVHTDLTDEETHAERIACDPE